MQPSGRIDINHVGLTGHSRFNTIVSYGRRIGVGFVFDEFGAGSLSPNGELFDSGGPKRVGRGNQD